jgi:hypothetical protein
MRRLTAGYVIKRLAVNLSWVAAGAFIGFWYHHPHMLDALGVWHP